MPVIHDTISIGGPPPRPVVSTCAAAYAKVVQTPLPSDVIVRLPAPIVGATSELADGVYLTLRGCAYRMKLWIMLTRLAFQLLLSIPPNPMLMGCPSLTG